MDLLEYQGKQLFAKHGVPVPEGKPASTVEDAVAAGDWIGVINAAAPVIFTLLMIVVIQGMDLFVREERVVARWRANLTSSLLFALAHANV